MDMIEETDTDSYFNIALLYPGHDEESYEIDR